MNITNKIYELGVFPEQNGNSNVVARVRWSMEFEDQGCVSVHGSETLLNTDGIQNFTPVDQLTKQQIIDWCIATEGGQHFLDRMTAFHAQQIAYQVAQIGIEVYTGFPVDAMPKMSAQPTIPSQVL